MHRKIVEEISPSKGEIEKYFELDNFVPHMTLEKTNYGLSKHELKEMAMSASEIFTTFPTFDANFVRVYQEVADKYRKLEDISLSEKS